MSEALLAILPRLDALNSFVRAPNCRTAGLLARVIYHYKREALRMITQQGLATHRLIATTTKCRDCRGSGRYTDWGGYTHNHCRLCSNSGSVKLRFIESTIATRTDSPFQGCIVWHTPERDAWAFISNTHEMREHPAGDWTVHQPGRDLDVEALADHLLAVEAFFLEKPRRFYASDFFEQDPHNQYQLSAGESDGKTCPLCLRLFEVPEGKYPHRYCLATGRIGWTAIVCAACHATRGNSGEIFEALRSRFPEYLWTPALRRWSASHPVLERRAA